MEEFTVTEVFDGDSFKVFPDWKWENRKGDVVRPLGYNTPEKGQFGYEQAKRKLTDLILNEKVKIGNVERIDTYGRLLAWVYYKDKSLAGYFPEYQV